MESGRDDLEQGVWLDCGVRVKPVYVAGDVQAADHPVGMPGAFPFTRGLSPGRPKDDPWVIRVYAGFGTPEDSNQRFRRLVEWGAEEIQMAVDLPTQVGYDSDHIMSTGEVGRVGVAIDSLHDMEVLFEGIPLDRLRCVGMLGNSFGPTALALFIALGEKQGLDPSSYTVDLQNDVLKEYVARGTQIYPIEPSIRVASDVVAYCAQHMPHWHPMSVCVNHLNAAGAGTVRGTAYAFANARAYIEHLLARGEDIDAIGPLFSMFLDERDDFFTTVGVFRASRRLWAKTMKEYGATRGEAMALRTVAYGHGRETLQEPINNIVRIAMGSFAYALGGVSALYNASFDEALSTPTEEAVKVAIRTQQILREEFGIGNVQDPLGGSHFVETLTNEIEDGIAKELQQVLEAGGAVAAIESGYIRGRLTEGAVRRQRWFEEGRRVSVGLNRYAGAAAAEAGRVSPFLIDPDVERRQVQSLQEVRRNRDNAAVEGALRQVQAAAAEDVNLVPPVLEAVQAYATIGEITDRLRAVFGEYRFREAF